MKILDRGPGGVLRELLLYRNLVIKTGAAESPTSSMSDKKDGSGKMGRETGAA